MNRPPEELRKQAVMINGKMTSKKGKAERERAIEDMRTIKKKFLFATYSQSQRRTRYSMLRATSHGYPNRKIMQQ